MFRECDDSEMNIVEDVSVLKLLGPGPVFK